MVSWRIKLTPYASGVKRRLKDLVILKDSNTGISLVISDILGTNTRDTLRITSGRNDELEECYTAVDASLSQNTQDAAPFTLTHN